MEEAVVEYILLSTGVEDILSSAEVEDIRLSMEVEDIRLSEGAEVGGSLPRWSWE